MPGSIEKKIEELEKELHDAIDKLSDAAKEGDNARQGLLDDAKARDRLFLRRVK